MKIRLVIFVNILIVSILSFSCNSDDNNSNDIDSIEIQDMDTIQSEIIDTISTEDDTTNDLKDEIEEYKVSKYICPQGDPEGNSNKAGICPVCEMELIENPDYTNKNSKN